MSGTSSAVHGRFTTGAVHRSPRALPEFFEESAEGLELWSPEPAARKAVYQCLALILTGPRRVGKTITDLLAARISPGS
ncbi:MAG: hypothetical protein OXL36_18590 [Bryobacterales bacterium]|nr:hypothetical protein [Bryobacterales bacterium]MDE0294618.1 hypothetical protein [Bryobacterales bacterium]